MYLEVGVCVGIAVGKVTSVLLILESVRPGQAIVVGLTPSVRSEEEVNGTSMRLVLFIHTNHYTPTF